MKNYFSEWAEHYSITLLWGNRFDKDTALYWAVMINAQPCTGAMGSI